MTTTYENFFKSINYYNREILHQMTPSNYFFFSVLTLTEVSIHHNNKDTIILSFTMVHVTLYLKNSSMIVGIYSFHSHALISMTTVPPTSEWAV
jgi:hypothetical protein